MNINSIAAVAVASLLLSAGAFAQTTPSANQAGGPGMHRALLAPTVRQNSQLSDSSRASRKAYLATMTADQRQALKADRRAKKEAKLAAMTPEQRTAYKADHHARHAARLAAMTPEQRGAYDAHKAQKKAGKKKSSR